MRGKKLTDFLNTQMQCKNITKNDYPMILLTRYDIESVLGVRISFFSNEKYLSFKGDKISAMKNALTLAKRPERG